MDFLVQAFMDEISIEQTARRLMEYELIKLGKKDF
jgi:hypothetical protein